ncbi:OsmC family protein [Acuticoccus yangtzensis]|uniref:OsmC family protein n=1 Tax=Acuticoccus yangtzensis TaxID=1443441 RepID=UPI0009498FD7|nr:OsmC family protein [Acuticoccus yangtzensis]
MTGHTAKVLWTARDGDDFLRGRYSRTHTLSFDGGTTVEGSPAAINVPAPWSDAAAVDPEEMFVAALSACHMLWFLDFARRAGVNVTRYEDDAVGTMADIGDGRRAVTRVALRPLIASDADAATLAALHEKAHHACFIANSVRTEIVVEPYPGA